MQQLIRNIGGKSQGFEASYREDALKNPIETVVNF